jgi:RNA polymerase sigma factor (TIGR02999 family)
MEITALIERARKGDRGAYESFWQIVYRELKAIAGRQLAGEAAGHTLQTTGLVNEVYLRLTGSRSMKWEDRAHFFGAAAQAMRRVLIDHARARDRSKRGGGRPKVSLSEAPEFPAAEVPALDILALHDALERLAGIDARKAQVVELRYFAGLTVEEIAQILDVATGTIAGDWKIAKMWLHRELTKGETHGPGALDRGRADPAVDPRP